MTRAALLPAGGDPFLLTYWLRHYQQLWADEVDELRILVNGQNDPEVREYMRLASASVPHASIQFNVGRVDHGANLERMVAETDATHVLFCEDDAFVRHSGVIEARFHRIERGATDVIGTARGNATPNLLARAAEKFGPVPQTESGEQGLSLYPCFLFARKSDLPANGYSGRFFPPGTYIESLDYTTTGEEAADTFTASTWELRAAGLRIEPEAAYRSDSAFSGTGAGRVDGGANNGDAPWFHVGSMSTGFGCSFMVPHDTGYAGLVAQVRPKGELRDWQKRMAWWTRVADATEGELPDYHRQYVESLNGFMADVEANPLEIHGWRTMYEPLVTWNA